ncbi:type I restriction-modification system, S subunit [Citreicella sp. SE45]|nr:type I restriction-modification system, S subunit [Citreicella sp. SE45]
MNDYVSVPSHYIKLPIIAVAKKNGGIFIDGDWIESKDLSDSGFRYLTTGNVGAGEFKDQGTGYISDSTFHRLRCTEVMPGDILVSRLNLPIGRACIVPDVGERMVTAVDNVIIRPSDEFDRRFLVFLFSAQHHSEMMANLARGTTMQRVSRSALGRARVYLPPFEEQTAIANYLDLETARLDGLIEKKGRFIELLKEKALAYSDRCVTGQTDSARDMRTSGIQWSPQLPAEWGVRRGKDLFREMARPVRSDDEIITAFRDGQVCLRSRRRTEGYTFAEKEVGYQRILKGDLVIHTMDAFAGAIGISEDNGKATGEYAVCTPKSPDIIPEYYALILRCMARRNYIFVLCPSVRERAPRFRFVRFAPVMLPVPPRAEQEQIVASIEEHTRRAKALIAKTERSIELLKEKRSALITAAVTGKIDVRSAA